MRAMLPSTGVVGSHEQRFFLSWARPLAPLATFAVYGAVWLVAPSDELLQIMAVLAASVAAGVAYAVAARRVAPARVLRVALPIDTLLIAGMTVALEHPDVLAIAYFWSIALSALFLRMRDTVANTLLAAVCAAVVPVLAPFDFEPSVVITDVIVLLLIGGLLSLFSRYVADASAAIAAERELDTTALAISQSVRSSLELGDVLNAMLEEIGRATHAQRTILRLAPTGENAGALYQWHPDDVMEYGLAAPPPFIQDVFATGVPFVAHSPADADESVRAFMAEIGSEAIVAFPIGWQSDVAAVVGITSATPRDWNRNVLPLFHRLSPQLAAALAQAALYEQQQATLDQFRDLSQLREELVANVSHELRTPLTSTLGFLQTLQRRGHELDESTRNHFIEIALREAERLARLVDDLLELTRLERGVLTLATGPVTVREVVERAALGLELDGRELRVEVAPDVVARADSDRLIQVFANLLSNAAKHGAGTITVKGDLGPRVVTVAICDTGPGIPNDRVGELFVPFARWGSHGDSTGLGLAIARGIVHAHGGTLFYRPGGGDTDHAFVVTLPREGVTPAPVQAPT